MKWAWSNRVVPRAELEESVKAMAEKIAAQPRLGLLLTKQAINHMEDLQGKRTGMDAVFAMHHFAHAQNQLVKGDYIAGFDGKSMAKANKQRANKDKEEGGDK